MTRIVAVSGSQSERGQHHTGRAVSVALDAAADAGAETGMIDLGTVDLPLYHPAEDVQGDSERLTRLVRGGRRRPAGTPVYHGSYSSTFKNFHDFCGSDEYENTAVGLLATAGGGSYGGTLEHLRSTFRNVHAWTVPTRSGSRERRDTSRPARNRGSPTTTSGDARRRWAGSSRSTERLRGGEHSGGEGA